MKWYLLFTTLLFPISLAAQNSLDSLDRYIQGIYSQYQDELAGMGVSIFSSDTTYYTQGFGYADVATQTPYTPNTIQNIASISKTFIGVSLLIAEREGLLSLEEPINTYLPFEVIHPRFPQEEITLKQLATHSAGIKDRLFKYNVGSYSKGKVPEMELGAYLSTYLGKEGKWYGKKSFTRYAPGTHYAYSNVGAALAAYVLECAAKMPFHTYTQQKILAPLGMDESGWSYGAIDESLHATLYKKSGKVKAPYTLITYPDGGMRTSVRGLTKHFQAIMQALNNSPSPILSQEEAQRLVQAHFPDSIPITNEVGTFNSGIFIEIEGPAYVGHTGGDPGVATLAFFDPQTDIGRIFFFNRGIPNEIGARLGEFTRTIDAFIQRIR